MKSLVELYKSLSPIQRSIVSAGIGFVFYGGWAVLVNFMHGKDSAFKAGLVQGLYSFVLTFFMTILLEATYQRVFDLLANARTAVAITVIFSCSIVFTGSWYINYLSGTPEIFKTVILGYIFGGLYAMLYSIGLARKKF